MTNHRGEQACRVCRCTYERGCASGCSWVAEDLCSVCEVICDVVFLIVAVVGPRWSHIVALVELSLAGAFEEEEADEKRIRAALTDLRKRRWADIATGNVYEATTIGRRHLGRVLARIHRDKIRMVYGETLALAQPDQAARGGR